jgi:hypothetical protein
MRRLLSLLFLVAPLLLVTACGGETREAAPPTAAASPTAVESRPTATTSSPRPTATSETATEAVEIPWQEAVDHIGEQARVCGYVPHTEYMSATQGGPTFLHIGASYLDPEHFTVTIWGVDRGNFATAPEEAYLATTVCVTGLVEPAGQAAGMTIRSPEDIEVVSEAVAAPTVEPTAPPAPPSPTLQPAAPDFSPFAKTWGRHGFGITVSTSGEATATWRVYKWCSDDPTPPCDDMVDSQIISGGQATIVFTEVVGETAHGLVTASTDESTLAGGVSLTLQPYDMALLESDAWAGQETLCGPNYWQEAPDWLKEQSPCGA